jgi:glyoxylase-like metal-dependent hydrolase (beta-lactamase superfamily II)
MRHIDLLHLGNPRVICCWETDGVIIDPGPQSCEKTLLEGLDGDVPSAILLTHIHFDHAGATGALVRRWPDVPVYVHERGAPHMADPARLVKSAARLYGGENEVRRLWGEIVPVPEANIRVLRGGETRVEDLFRVQYTPGHASHHVCFLHERDGWAFVGDMVGVSVPPNPFTLAPTMPPEFDLEAWERSVEAIAAWQPEGLALTHFGPTEHVAAQIEAIRTALRSEVELYRAGDFAAQLEARVRAGAGEDADALLQAAPPEHLRQGLERWEKLQAP